MKAYIVFGFFCVYLLIDRFTSEFVTAKTSSQSHNKDPSSSFKRFVKDMKQPLDRNSGLKIKSSLRNSNSQEFEDIAKKKYGGNVKQILDDQFKESFASFFEKSFGYNSKNEIKNQHEKEDEVTYVGAVIEYEPFNEWTDDGQGYHVLRKNAHAIVRFAARAKNKGADIMVAPEYGLQSLDMFANDTEKFLTYTQFVPDPSEHIVPCYFANDSDHFEALQILSCGAIRHKIYLVIDVAELYPCSEETVKMAPWEMEPSKDCPETGFIFYNTEIVLDRKGTVTTRYRKQNLFMEDIFTPGSPDDKSALFLTDFNVLFSLQTCFDIVYEHPGYSNVRNIGIRDVAMGMAWVDYAPFEFANLIQNGWSRGLETNLLAAGHHKPEKGKLGSGIFRGYSKDSPVYTYDKDSGNVLLVSNVTTIPATSFIAGPLKDYLNVRSQVKLHESENNNLNMLNVNSNYEEHRKHLIIHENLENYTALSLKNGTPGEFMHVSACSNDSFCCDLNYQYSGDLNYKFLVFSGQFSVGFGRYILGEQICAVVWCKTSNIGTCALTELGLPKSDSFGPFTMSSSNFAIDSIFPGGNHRNLSLINYKNLKFQANGSHFILSANEPVENHLVSSLFGRWYSNDG